MTDIHELKRAFSEYESPKEDARAVLLFYLDGVPRAWEVKDSLAKFLHTTWLGQRSMEEVGCDCDVVDDE